MKCYDKTWKLQAGVLTKVIIHTTGSVPSARGKA